MELLVRSVKPKIFAFGNIRYTNKVAKNEFYVTANREVMAIIRAVFAMSGNDPPAIHGAFPAFGICFAAIRPYVPDYRRCLAAHRFLKTAVASADNDDMPHPSGGYYRFWRNGFAISTKELIMSQDFLPDRDKLIVQWATACASYAAPRPIQTGLATTTVTELTTRRNDFQNSILLVESTAAAYHAAVKSKNTSKKRIEETARLINQQVQGNPAVTDETKLGLGLTVKKKREHKKPQVPTDLRVKGTENGVNLVRWKANGNRAGALYEVWAKYPDATAWQYVESVNAISFRHTNVAVGAKIQYRVRAKVNGQFSIWSNEAGISDGVSLPALVLTKAA